MAGKRGDESRRRVMTDGGWQRILRIMDDVYADYLSGMVALRKRVVDDMRRKLNDGGGSDHARRGARSRSAPASRRR